MTSATDKPDCPPARCPAIRTIAMPSDTNPSGDIFGGWVMSQLDLAGATTAQWRAQGRVATVAAEGMTFLKPVQVGDIVCVYSEIVREGKTSLTTKLELWVMRRNTFAHEKVTEGLYTFVAIDDIGNKRPLPPMPASDCD